MRALGRTSVVIPLCMVAVSVLWLYMALTEYGFWDARRGPLGGFFPAIVSVIMLLSSLVALASGLREQAIEYNRRIAIPFACILGMIGGSYVIGMFPIMTIYLFGWLRFMGKYSMKTTLTLTVLMMAGLYGIFVLWLQVTFPAGIIYEILYRRA